MRELSHDSSSHENRGTKKIIYLYIGLFVPPRTTFIFVLFVPFLLILFSIHNPIVVVVIIRILFVAGYAFFHRIR